MSTSDLHSAWAQLFVSSLVGAGVADVVVSPGSRSTPLALAFAQHPQLNVEVILDERVAAFYALGQARVSGRPSVLLCTSGTAGAHYFPALIEASYSYVPLLVVTADRPWEDYDCAAAQTIDQVKLFGDFVRHYFELGLPDPTSSALHAVVRIAAQAVHTARGPIPGPVHVNARFRKPLEPVAEDGAESWQSLLQQVRERVSATVISPAASFDRRAVEALRALCEKHTRGLLICGPAWCQADAAALRQSLFALSQKTGFPIWAESTSGARFGGGAAVCGGFDAALRSASFRATYAPELLIEIGGPVVSAAYPSYLAQHPICPRVVIAPHGWNDPYGSASLILSTEPAPLLQAVAADLAARTPDPQWTESLLHIDQKIWQVVRSEQDDQVLSEGRIAQQLVEALPADAVLLIGNSLPVRELDLFCAPMDKPLRVLHQRGASGIDGLMAGAAGARSQSESPLALLLGDLSALHDLGALGVLQQSPGPLAVVIVQNGGGRIFEQLPIGRSVMAKPHFEQLFVTPQHVNFAQAAAAFAIPFMQVTTPRQLANALAQAMSSDRPLLIEAVVPPGDGLTRRQRIWAKTATAIEQQSADSQSSSISLLQSPEQSPQTIPAVYLHGFLGSPALWEPLARVLGSPHQNEFLPGHGRTPWTVPSGDFYAVIDALLERIPFPQFSLFGYSLGARLALALALRHPQRVSSLVLVGVDPGIQSVSERSTRLQWEDAQADKLLSGGLEMFVKEWELLPLFDSQRALLEPIQAAQRSARLAHDFRAIAWSLRTLGTGRMPSLWPLLPSLRIPTTVISGALDAKFTALGQALAENAPNCRHHVLADAGHNPILETPLRVLSLLQNLIPSFHGATQS